LPPSLPSLFLKGEPRGWPTKKKRNNILNLYGEDTTKLIFDYLKNYASRRPNYSLPSPSYYAADTITPSPNSYTFIILSTPERPIERIYAQALPYSEKEYITDANLTTPLVNCSEYTCF
jgi:hypothetical protein